MDKDATEIPLSETNVTLKLAEIQKRCSEFLQDSESSLELTLEEPGFPGEAFNPYDHA